MSRADDAAQRYYEIAPLAGDLTDTAAGDLLAWADAEIHAQDSPALDDAAFAQRAAALEELLRHTNRIVGRHTVMDEPALAAALDGFAAAAARLGKRVAAGPSATYRAVLATLNEQGALHGLLALLDPPADAPDVPPSDAAPPSLPVMPTPLSTQAPLPPRPSPRVLAFPPPPEGDDTHGEDTAPPLPPLALPPCAPPTDDLRADAPARPTLKDDHDE